MPEITGTNSDYGCGKDCRRDRSSSPPAHSIAGHLRLPSKVHQARYRQTNQHDRVDPKRSGNLITFRHRKLIENHNDQQRHLRPTKAQ